MASATGRPTFGGEAWERALTAARKQRARERISEKQLTNSASRIDRSYERLNESAPRVKRGRQRKV